MTSAEKKLLQAQHRLEEAQARDRVKERKARTRRLIQEGGDSGKGVAGGADDGAVCAGGLPDAEAVAAQLNPLGGLRETGGLLFFSRKGALTHRRVGTNSISFAPPQAAGLIHSVPFCGSGMPAASCALRGGLRLLRQPPDNATAPAGAAVIVCAGLSCFRFENSLRPARTNLLPAALPQRWTGVLPVHFLFAKEKQKKENEVNETCQFIIWKRRWSAGAQGAPPWPLPLI